jgi:hypothetical protein
MGGGSVLPFPDKENLENEHHHDQRPDLLAFLKGTLAATSS